jgi:hypothetical protein
MFQDEVSLPLNGERVHLSDIGGIFKGSGGDRLV